MKVNVINNSKNKLDLPAYSTAGAAGFDIKADEAKIIFPGETQIISTGMHFEVPEGYALFILSRSGLASKGIVVGNSPGLVDSDYTGEVKIIIRNTNTPSETLVEDNNVFKISVGDRIAQGVIMKVEQVGFEQVSEIKKTERGAGGFGSTGVS